MTTESLQIVCVSDTHNEDCRNSIPPGDIFIHAGDMTDVGTGPELKAAFDWISSLPHKIKIIVAGNHDRGLDLSHDAHDNEIFHLFTSPEAKSSGIHYLNEETRTIRLPGFEQQRAIKVYGNPKQPDFLNSTYAFTYKPHPSPEAAAAWEHSPRTPEEASIWIMHGPPKDRLDYINIPEYPGLQGCVAQAQRIAAVKPLLCVFGHYHVSNGVERVRWKSDGNRIEEAKLVTKPRDELGKYDFSSNGADGVLNAGHETVFVNAAWLPGRDKKVKERNIPAVVTLDLPVFQDS